jgi:hypothetical protein
MLSNQLLKDALAQITSDGDKALICLAANPLEPRAIKEIVLIGHAAGWRSIKKLNVSQLLVRANNCAIRAHGGWELTSNGKQRVAELVRIFKTSPFQTVASSLNDHAANISNPNTRKFVSEAIACFEGRQFRAAVLLSWVGAVAVLQDHVFTTKLLEFNSAAKARDQKWKVAQTIDDIGLMKEDTFLEVLQDISVLGKNVKQELKKGLTLRNGCGHPNSLAVAEHKVSAHIEDLILNVYSVF